MAEITRDELMTLLNNAGTYLSLVNWDLTGLDMSGLDLQNVDLQESNLNSADLHGSNLREANLSQADLSGANLEDADLRGASVSGEQLSEAATLQNATLPDGMGLEGLPARFATRLRKADLYHHHAVKEAFGAGEKAFTARYGIGPATLAAVREWLNT